MTTTAVPQPRAASDERFRRAMDYENPDVVYKFTSLWNISEAEAADVFEETKKYIWLGERWTNIGRALDAGHPARIIDEMWHTFILFSRDYTRYCETVYGHYVHHAPARRSEHKREQADLAEARRNWIAHQELTWLGILDELGEDTLLKWYVEYPLRFDQAFFRTQSIALEMTWVVPPSLIRVVNAKRAHGASSLTQG